MYYVEESNEFGPCNTFVCETYEGALELHSLLIAIDAGSRIFQVLEGVEVDLTG